MCVTHPPSRIFIRWLKHNSDSVAGLDSNYWIIGVVDEKNPGNEKHFKGFRRI